MITTTDELRDVCQRFATYPFITIDTEFLREYTYFPKLCLVQIASLDEAYCIDALSNEIDLTPLFELLENQDVVKVFHSARQDIEIFYHLTGKIPTPIFDTQVASMVLGFGDSVSYQHLVQKITHISLDKGMRITDWTKRPLKEAQIEYALRDVTHLRDVYLYLKQELEKQNRSSWTEEEMARLTAIDTYAPNDEQICAKLKYGVHGQQNRRVYQALYLWREHKARQLNQLKKQVLKDELLCDLALIRPQSVEDLKTMRSLPPSLLREEKYTPILEVIQKVLKNEWPIYAIPNEKESDLSVGEQNLLEMLRMLLSLVAIQQKVAPRLIAVQEDLVHFVKKTTEEIPFLTGWRYEIFGAIAQSVALGQTAFIFDPLKKRICFKDMNHFFNE